LLVIGRQIQPPVKGTGRALPLADG